MKTETIFQVLLWILFMATGMVGLRSAAQTDAPARRPYATVSGTVRDTRTNRVLPAVHVAVPGTGIGTVTRLLARCDQVEGLAEPVRIIRGLDGDTACPACSHGVALFDGVHATCLRCRERWLPLVPLLTAA